ncbi:MAG: alpha/beta fold hydrolase [Mycobacterium sp.]|nr:alpha/beta fold hydrolase [Mycobacterium sp.]
MTSISLLHGWLPVALQVIALVVLLSAVGWRNPRWRTLWLPVSAAVGLLAVGIAYWFFAATGASGGRTAPAAFWIWVALTGLTLAVAVLGWRTARWWRRGAAVTAVPLCALCVALVLNTWTGYVPTVQSGWDELNGKPLAGQTDVTDLSGLQHDRGKKAGGTIVSVSVPADASGFAHRDELVYLPPAWFASDPPPQLPVLMMIGGVFGTPADWIRSGAAQTTLDDFAAAHGGAAPVVVFVDQGGTFHNDTECVNGPRGNAADHLTKDVVPYMISKFGVSADPARWGVVGWSMGGTCAFALAVKYPELFGSFVAIDSEQFPNAGTREQTIARLFNGDEAAFESFAPASVIVDHGPYSGLAGWFAISEDIPTLYYPPAAEPGVDVAVRNAPDPLNHAKSVNYLCGLASDYGIGCSVVADQTRHAWPAAAKAFSDALPWLAGRIGVPGAAPQPMPGAPPPSER